MGKNKSVKTIALSLLVSGALFMITNCSKDNSMGGTSGTSGTTSGSTSSTTSGTGKQHLWQRRTSGTGGNSGR